MWTEGLKVSRVCGEKHRERETERECTSFFVLYGDYQPAGRSGRLGWGLRRENFGMSVADRG